jgi:hypothetical protein
MHLSHKLALAVAIEFDELIALGAINSQALESVRRNHDDWEVSLLDALERIRFTDLRGVLMNLPVRKLRAGMILDADVVHVNGTKLMVKGFRLNAGTLERLRNLAQIGGVIEPIRVLVTSQSVVRDTAA